MRITWYSNQDVLKIYFDEDIETPLALDDVLITDYVVTPLKNITKYEMAYTGVLPFDIDQLQPLTFERPDCTEQQLFWLCRIITIVLYKQFNYTSNIIISNVLTPMLDNEPIFDVIDLPINEWINYKPIIDLYQSNVSLEIAASDLIWTMTLPDTITNIYDIPCIELNSDEEKNIVCTRAEFSINLVTPMISQIVGLSRNTFSLQLHQINRKLIRNFEFVEIPSSLPDIIFLQHDYPGLDKTWYLQQNANRPMYSFYGEWMFEYTSDIKTLAYLKYIAMIALNNPELNDDIDIGSDLLIHIPVTSLNDIKSIKFDFTQKPLIRISDKPSPGPLNDSFKIKNKWATIKMAN